MIEYEVQKLQISVREVYEVQTLQISVRDVSIGDVPLNTGRERRSVRSLEVRSAQVFSSATAVGPAWWSALGLLLICCAVMTVLEPTGALAQAASGSFSVDGTAAAPAAPPAVAPASPAAASASPAVAPPSPVAAPTSPIAAAAATPNARNDSSDSIADSLEVRLSDHGFENVASVVVDGNVIVTYENRRFRYEIRAVKEAAEVVARVMADLFGEGIDPSGRLTLVPQRRGTPLLALTIPPAAYHAHASGESSVDQFVSSLSVSRDVMEAWDALSERPRRNASYARFDVVVHPQLVAQFGGREDVFESQVNVAPEVRTSIWKGMLLSMQWIFPLQNELERDGDFVRPGVTAISQVFRLPRESYASLTAGYFTRNRYGVDAEAATFLHDGRWMLSARAGYTGDASFRRGEWTYTRPSVVTFSAGVDYFVPAYTTKLGVRVERFIYEDLGVRFDMERAFGEVRLGFFGLTTSEGDNVGFQLVIPLFVQKYTAPARLRVRPARSFPWGYRYQGLTQAGISYRTRTRPDAPWEVLLPQLVRPQLDLMHGERK